FTVTDDLAADEACPASPSSLAPTDKIGRAASRAVAQADVDAGSVTNTADGHGLFGLAAVDTATPAQLTITATQTPALSIDKSSVDTTYSAPGDVLDYSYTLTNTGNVTLTGPFTVTDDLAADEACPASPSSLAPTD